MKIGLLAYSSDTGLGNQTWEFYKNIHPEKVLVCDLSGFNNMPVHHERYEQPRITNGIPTNADMEWLVDGMDVVFVAETPLNYYLYEYAQKQGVKVIQQYNYEFLDYFRKPHLPKPAVLGAPSAWNTDIVEKLKIAKVMDWPVPVNRKLIPFREINECKTFIHVIGRPAVHDRNGTLSFFKAIRKLGNRFNYKVFLQPPTDERAREYFEDVKRELRRAERDLPLQIVINVPNYQDIYTSGDVMVYPRRYGGLCLPVQEALSAGMPVIMTDISPNNARLPKEWLGSAEKITSFRAHTEIDVYDIDDNELVEIMNRFADPTFMQEANQKANEIADSISWETLTLQYMKWFEQVINN